MKRIALFVLGAALFVCNTSAKRGPKPQVAPVHIAGLEVRAPNTPDTEGIVEVWNLSGTTVQWTQRVYRTLHDPLLEQDVQWDFIKSMTASPEGNRVSIVTERGRKYVVD